MAEVFEQPASDIKIFELPVPIPLPYSLMVLLPFALPLLIVLFAAISACCCCGKKWQYHTSCCSVWGMCLLMPFLFYITALLTPMLFIFHDGCSSMGTLGQLYVSNSDVKLCGDIGGTYLPSSNECQFALELDVSPFCRCFCLH